MTNVEALEKQVKQLGPTELAEFRDWFLEFEADAWDTQIEADVKSGKLDALGRKALAEHKAGRTTRI